MAEQAVKKNKQTENNERQLEESIITFKNRTTDDEVKIKLTEKDGGRLDVEIDFDPKIGEQDQHSIVGNCAMAVIEYLGK